MIVIGFKAFVLHVLPKLGPLACSTDWFLNGVSWYKENYKDTWKDAQQGCNTFGGVLERRLVVISKTDFDSLRGGYWSEENENVRNESLGLLSPKTEQHEIFPFNGSMRYKTEWDTEVNFDFVFLFSIDIH